MVYHILQSSSQFTIESSEINENDPECRLVSSFPSLNKPGKAESYNQQRERIRAIIEQFSSFCFVQVPEQHLLGNKDRKLKE
jgi:hypothetical protein